MPATRPKPKRRSPLRADPSQTAGLRRALAAELTRRYARIRLEVYRAVAGEDVFGLRPAVTFNATRKPTGGNCGTGAGGFRPGNTCAKGSGGVKAVTSIGPPKPAGQRPRMSDMELGRYVDSISSAAGLQREMPILTDRVAALEWLSARSDRVPEYMRDGLTNTLAHLKYERQVREAADWHLANTPVEHMTRDAYYQALLHADHTKLWAVGSEGTFFRAGTLPPGGRSRNGATGQLEDGVSVYATPHATSLAGLASRDWYAGRGNVVAVGSDDEPVIRPIGKWKRFAGKDEHPVAAHHREMVIRAIRAGRSVPEKVLADYPDLASTTTDTLPAGNTVGAVTYNAEDDFIPSDLPPPTFSYLPDDEKVSRFQGWMYAALLPLLIGPPAIALWNRYTRMAYERGASRAFDDVGRSGRLAAPALEREARDGFLRLLAAHPDALEKVRLLGKRAFNEAENAADDMATKLIRAVSDGLARRASPRDLARELVKVIDAGRDRAVTTAGNELVRANADGTLDAFGRLGVTEVGAVVELTWTTAGDERVCPRCASMNGRTFPIGQVRGLIPAHVGCRCRWTAAPPKPAVRNAATTPALVVNHGPALVTFSRWLVVNAAVPDGGNCGTGTGGREVSEDGESTQPVEG